MDRVACCFPKGVGSVGFYLGPLVSALGLMRALVRTLLCPRRVGAVPGRDGLAHPFVGESLFWSFSSLCIMSLPTPKQFSINHSCSPRDERQQQVCTSLPPLQLHPYVMSQWDAAQ